MLKVAYLLMASLPPALVTTLVQTQTSNYAAVSAVAFVAYDIAVMMSKEIDLIWRTRWSVPKICYLIVRYYGLCYVAVIFAFSITMDLQLELCRNFLHFVIFGGAPVLATSVNIIIVLRLNALYYQSKKVLAFLVLVMSVELAVTLYISVKTGIVTSRTAFLPPPGVPYPGCLALDVSNGALMTAWIPILLCAAIFFLMTVWKAIETLADENGKIHWRNLSLRSIPPVYLSFIEGGAAYYCIVTAALLVSLLTLILVTSPLRSIVNPWLAVAYSLAGSRLVLSLRKIRETSGDSYSLQPVQFARNPAQSTTIESESFRPSGTLA